MHIKKIYWLLPIILFVAQAVYTFNSMSQIRFEELGEVVRNPFWVEHHKIYDKISTNISWYVLVLAVHKIFGFTLFAGKYIKLFIAVVSLFSLAFLLKKYLGIKKAWLPLIAIGFSPTILFFTTIQSEYALDLLFLPIFLLIIDAINFRKNSGYLMMVLLWSLVMFNFMAYPTFFFYIPSLVFLQSWKMRKFLAKNPKAYRKIIISGFLSILGFSLPLILILSIIRDPVLKEGIFRGGGGYVNLRNENISANLKGVRTDLFDKGKSYYFEVNQGEFSGGYPIITIILVVFLIIFLLKQKSDRKFIFAALLLFMISFILATVIFDPTEAPGIRRYSGVLAAFYCLFAFIIFKFGENKWVMLVLLLIPLHHILVYPDNLSHLKDPSVARDTQWFAIADTPKHSLDILVEKVQKEDLNLVCSDNEKQFMQCERYQEVYAAVAGSCLWNRLQCHQIYGYDINSKKFLPLSIDFFAKKIF